MSTQEVSAIRRAGDDDYTCDLRHLPDLSSEERDHLVALLADAQTGRVPASQVAWAKERLIEGHLWLGPVLASKWCPPHKYHLFDDLVQEAHLKLLSLVQTFDYTSGKNFTAWATVTLTHHIQYVMGEDRFASHVREEIL